MRRRTTSRRTGGNRSARRSLPPGRHRTTRASDAGDGEKRRFEDAGARAGPRAPCRGDERSVGIITGGGGYGLARPRSRSRSPPIDGAGGSGGTETRRDADGGSTEDWGENDEEDEGWEGRRGMEHGGVGKVGPGMRAYLTRRRKNLSASQHRTLVLVVTFFAYMMYHASRKPPSIVKSVLNPDEESRARGAKGWAPFDGEDGTSVIGACDFAFLAAYSIGMFFSGHIGDRMDLRKFLTYGMVLSGFWVSMFGMGYYWNFHSVWFYVGVQIVAGVFQSTGWPSVVSVMGNWFGKGKRGLIMGVWNAHTSVGNMFGSLVAAAALKNAGWGMSFIIPGALTMVMGVLVWNFLVVTPEDVGLPPANAPTGAATGADDEESVARRRLLDSGSRGGAERERAVGFTAALKIPGVITFSLCLFFTKLVAYTFLYWLPFYIERTEIAGQTLTAAKAGELSVIFDLGGILGGILAGYISDKYNARSMTAAGFVYLSIPVLYLYREMGSVSMSVNLGLMALSGMLVNGPYALITTAVSADLGTHESLKGNSRALATVTAIIDGTGSIGAAIGPMLTGFITSLSDDWNHVFYMLYAADLCAGLLLTRLIFKEARALLAAAT